MKKKIKKKYNFIYYSINNKPFKLVIIYDDHVDSFLNNFILKGGIPKER